MNREIKFRGLRADTNEWVYGYYVKDSAFNLGIFDVPLAEARVCHVIVSEGEFFHVKPESVGQFSGVLDASGVDIYTGDSLTPEFYRLMHDPKFKCAVVFENGMFCFELNGGLIQDIKPLYRSMAIAENAGSPYIIIGNIHTGEDNHESS